MISAYQWARAHVGPALWLDLLDDPQIERSAVDMGFPNQSVSDQPDDWVMWCIVNPRDPHRIETLFAKFFHYPSGWDVQSHCIKVPLASRRVGQVQRELAAPNLFHGVT
ncbi:hypothetical protein RRG08_019662 [Elysia crispata]|uniref:Uncharacterized protein n=1 Tax=Elysia crispata TaxID=231223 RepID=A0AAE1CV55_9GAST|nr:hypothetical protein RRG08_019662 [Elysia crispata]